MSTCGSAACSVRKCPPAAQRLLSQKWTWALMHYLVASMGAWRTAKLHLNCDSIFEAIQACMFLSKAPNEPMTPCTDTVQESNGALKCLIKDPKSLCLAHSFWLCCLSLPAVCRRRLCANVSGTYC